MKKRYIVAFIAAILLMAAAILSLSDRLLSPYVPFKEAKQDNGAFVQVIGRLDHSVPIVYGEKKFTFTLIDTDKTTMKITYSGLKPLNFQHAEQIVLLGHYDTKDGLFHADRILVKCPSKYKKRLKIKNRGPQ